MNYSVSAEEFAKIYEKYIDMGVSILGGCCGTTPEYIAKLDELRKTKKIGKRNRKYICNTRKLYGFGENTWRNVIAEKRIRSACVGAYFRFYRTETDTDAGHCAHCNNGCNVVANRTRSLDGHRWRIVVSVYRSCIQIRAASQTVAL